MMKWPVAEAAWLAVCVGVSLSACGRDNYASIRNLRAVGHTIVCLGDSLTEGVGARTGEDYPSVLANRLGLPIVNAGHPGNTTADALMRLQDVLNENPRLVIVLLGGNDFLRQIPLQETKRNLEEIVRRIQNHGAMVVIVGMKLGLFTDEYGPLFQDIADRLGALHVPQLLNGILTDSKLKSDGIHPNAAGYQLMAERMVKQIKPLLEEADRRRGGIGPG
jgi:acyl-CoA thioesterase-1